MNTEPPAHSHASRLVKVLFGLAVLGFGIAFVASRWGRVSSALAATKPGWLVLGVVVAVAGQWAAALGFRALLSATSRPLPVPDVARVYFVSQLGKYIPGSVWPIVALTEMTRRYGVTRSAAALAGLLSLMFSLVVGAAVGAAFLLAGAVHGAASLWWLAVAVPVAVVLLHPRVINAATAWALRLLRRDPVPVRLGEGTLLRAVGWPLASWVLLGLHCWALVVALGGPAVDAVAAAIGGFALAYVAGTLFVPAPAGAGVREAVLGLALAGVVAQSATFGHDQVLVVVLLSRVLLALLDFAQAGVALAVNRRAVHQLSP